MPLPLSTNFYSAKNDNVEDNYIKGAYASNTYARDICAKNTFLIIDVYIKGTGLKNICNSAYKPSKSSI